MGNTIHILLDNIRSAHNVGSILRSADAAGVSRVYLEGVTPDPIDRFGRARKDIAKVSLGAENSVSWEHVEQIEDLVTNLKEEGFEIVSVEQTDNAINYGEFRPKGDVLYVFGSETNGISTPLLKLSDKTIFIPMKGKKESLNVSVTAGVILLRS